MLRYIARRLLAAVVVVWLASLIVFFLVRWIPGDPLQVLYGISQTGLTEEQEVSLRHKYGLDRPLIVQYGVWLGNVFKGDLGQSVLNKSSVTELIGTRFWPTLQLGAVSLVLALIVAIPAGVLSALKPNSLQDSICTIGSFAGAAIPYFLTAFLLIYIVGVQLEWLPTFGYVSPLEDPVENLKRLTLPAITLGVPYTAILMRQTRSSMLEVMYQQYITTARSKGLAERRVVINHAMKNVLLPVVTVLGLQLGNLIGGAVITETMYAYPGMGRLLVDATFARDYAVIQAIVLMAAVAVTLSSILVDLTYAYLDPRIRYT